jgi:hypothetical protein
MYMVIDGKTSTDSGFKDMKTGLIAFGIIQILIGMFCSFGAFAVMLVMLLPNTGQTTSVNPTMLIPSGLIYSVAAVWFIWMGFGSIRAKRWARALILVTSWIGLVSGFCAIIYMLMFLPAMSDQIARNGKLPAEAVVLVKYVIVALMAFIYIIIPGALVLFYGNRHVRETCERRDPDICWTDKCPLPVLAISIIFVFLSASMLLMGFYGWVVPFFGVILSGTAGAGVTFVCLALFGYVALGSYRLDMSAWWCAVLLMIAWGASVAVTFSRVNLFAFYEKMNYPAEQLALMKQLVQPMSNKFVWSFLLWAVVILGYLVYTRRYFTRAAQNPDGMSKNQN